MIRTADGAPGSPVSLMTGQVTEEEPCSQKGKRIKFGIGLPRLPRAEMTIFFYAKNPDFCVKRVIFDD
jgi:hypothetical protein